ncbi:hypothetical protein CR513_62052, partial [Mucuna pruriens]
MEHEYIGAPRDPQSIIDLFSFSVCNQQQHFRVTMKASDVASNKENVPSSCNANKGKTPIRHIPTSFKNKKLSKPKPKRVIQTNFRTDRKYVKFLHNKLVISYEFSRDQDTNSVSLLISNQILSSHFTEV